MSDRFKDDLTFNIYKGVCKKGIPSDVIKIAKIKLIRICAAKSLDVLKIPLANNLEKLKGDRKGQYSIRVNDKYRICFKWNNNLFAYDIEFIDYHK